MDGASNLPVEAAAKAHHHDAVSETSDTLSAEEIKSWVHEILDWIVKLLPVIATIAVTILADGYKTSLTASTLLSEREKADSQLRSEMFAKLVDPISGPRSGSSIPIEREQLLAELLSLNFHEHIGLKPLLSHVDARLAVEGNSAEKAGAARKSFRAVARTVISRQTSMLTRSSDDMAKEDGARIQRMDIGAGNPEPEFAKYLSGLKDDTDYIGVFNELIEVDSPTGKDHLLITVRQPNWDNETFNVEVSIYDKKAPNGRPLANHEFELSWFDFPLTDNTLLADGTRFAIVLDQVYDVNDGRISGPKIRQASETSTRRVRMNIIWFPKDYIAAHERPTNYRQFRKSMGFDR